MKVYLCRQERRLVDYLFRPCVCLPPPTDAVLWYRIDVHAVLDWRTELGRLMFMCILYITRPAAASQCAYVFIYIHADLIGVQARPGTLNTQYRRGFRVCLPCVVVFSLFPSTQLTDTDHLVQGYPFFSLLEGPGEKTDWMDVTLSQVGEPLSLEGAGTFVLGGAKRDGRSCCRDVHGRRKWWLMRLFRG